MTTDLSKSQYDYIGEKGLPEDYPVPNEIECLLFYIQRNLNKNTVVYELNKYPNGRVNPHYPMRVYWVQYSDGGVQEELNFIQNKLAFGYTTEQIDANTFEIIMVSYKALRFFLAQDNDGRHRVITTINGTQSYLSNIYVYANELGLFPDVKYFELYGETVDSRCPCYQKILI